MKTFSKDWTDEERLKLIMLLAEQIQSDIRVGRYGAVTKEDERGLPLAFRPNMQSIMNVIVASADELEAVRESLEDLVRENLSEDERDEFFTKSLVDVRREIS